MNWELEDNKIRRYLLNALPAEAAQQVEESLLRDDDYAERILMAEDELIDDYARDLLDEKEQRLFDQGFSLTSQRQQKLLIAQASANYARNQAAKPDVAPLPKQNWWKKLFEPGWKIVAYAALVLGVGLGIWRMNTSDSDIVTAMNVINQAFRYQRPLEARITGLNYAPFPKTMGDGEEKFDYVALNRAERILLDFVAQHPTAEAHHALGRLYLAQKKFDSAEKSFNAALQSAPDNAQLHSDLGAAMFERWDRERSAAQPADSENLKLRSLEHLEKALALDASLREARFNLALLYQASKQAQLARAEWEKYLAHETDSRGKKEAERNLELLK